MASPVVHVVLVWCVVLGLRHCVGLGQDSAPTVADPSDIQLRGTVVDADGQPIGGARVILVAPRDRSDDYDWPENMVPRATVETDTQLLPVRSACRSHAMTHGSSCRRRLRSRRPPSGLSSPFRRNSRSLACRPTGRWICRWSKPNQCACDWWTQTTRALAATKVAIAEQGEVTIPYTHHGAILW